MAHPKLPAVYLACVGVSVFSFLKLDRMALCLSGHLTCTKAYKTDSQHIWIVAFVETKAFTKFFSEVSAPCSNKSAVTL